MPALIETISDYQSLPSIVYADGPAYQLVALKTPSHLQFESAFLAKTSAPCATNNGCLRRA
ncbi:MAG: hypothetical protein PHW63_00420 [Alphaproteobacteria bacterium]|nr:hypothetical protein [Alphaproteobacteria bacterium]